MTGGICGAPVRRSNREQGLRTACDATRTARSATATGAALIAAGIFAAAGCGKPAGSVLPVDDAVRVSERSALNAVTMYGLLVDAQGAPVAGANIEVRAPGESEVVGSDVSDAEGSFDLDVESGVYDVRVIPRDDAQPQTFPRQLIGFNGGGTLELVLAAVATGPVPVSLFVVDQNGHPLPGSACNFSTCVDIGDDGTAQLAADATEGLQVDLSGAWDTGRLRIRPAAIGRGGGTVRTIVAPRFQFTGQIVDAGGAPVPGAALSFPTCYAVDTADLASTACPKATVADANGRFQLTLPPGRFPVVLQTENGPSFDVVIAGDTDVTFTIPAVQHLSGRVVDRNGAGVPLQSVCLSHPTCVTRVCRPLCAGTDGNGLYNLDLPGGDYQLTLVGRLGDDSRFYQLTRAFSFSATQELNVSLPNRTLSGQLLDISGAPAAGVSIFAASYSASIGDLTGVVGAALQVTDTDGRFQFTLAAPGQMQLRVFGPHPGRFDVTVSDDVDLLLQLSPPRDIAGVLMDDNRQPIAGQRVCYEQQSGGTFCGTSDASGVYRLTLVPGDYEVVATVIDGSEELTTFFSQTIAVPGGQSMFPIVLTRPVFGHLIDLNGDPIANASITRSCASLTRTDGTETACDGSTVVTDETGAFRFAWLPGTAPSLQIQLPGAAAPVQVVATQMSFDDLAELTVAIRPF